MKLILFGPPGSGKGTQASLLAKKINIPHLSTGDILRLKLNDEDELANELSNIMSSGNLVPDSILNPIVTEKLLSKECENGFILDGYPRNKSQSDFLIDFLRRNKIDLDLIIDFKADTETIENNETTETTHKTPAIEDKIKNIVEENVYLNVSEKHFHNSCIIN